MISLTGGPVRRVLLRALHSSAVGVLTALATAVTLDLAGPKTGEVLCEIY